MFERIGDELYYDGKLFAKIVADPVTSGGWFYDADVMLHNPVLTAPTYEIREDAEEIHNEASEIVDAMTKIAHASTPLEVAAYRQQALLAAQRVCELAMFIAENVEA